MSELEDKLNSILSSPQEMEKIMGIARSLSDSMGNNSNDAGTANSQEHEATASPFGNIDPKMLQIMSKIMGEYSSASSDKTALLNSMKPFLKEDRRSKIDKAVEIAKMAKIAKIAFSEFSGGDNHF